MLGNVSLPNSWSAMPGANATPGDWMNAYAQMGQASTAANQQLGNIFTAGSNQNLAQQQQALQQAYGHLRGTNRANIRSIDRRFSAESGDMAQQLINRGLGNSTIQASMQTGLTRAHADAISGSRAAFGGKMYEAAYQNAIANSGLAQQQLNTQFQGTNIGYPDMGAFAQMASAAGAGGGGGVMPGGGYTVMPERPIGGERPAWTYYGGGGGGDIGTGGFGGGMGGWATGYGGNQVANVSPGDPYGAVAGGLGSLLGPGAAGMAGLYASSQFGGGGDF